MERMYNIQGVIRELYCGERIAKDVPVTLLYPRERQLDRETMCYYHRYYEHLEQDDYPYVDNYIQEAFTEVELKELKESGFLDQFKPLFISELIVIGERESIRLDKLKGLDEEQARTLARSYSDHMVVSGIMNTGLESGEDIIVYDDTLSFPVGVYYNLHRAKFIS